MNISDLHTLIFAFFGVMLAEVVVKPIAIRIGRYALKKLDDRVLIIPDWLSRQDKECDCPED